MSSVYLTTKKLLIITRNKSLVTSPHHRQKKNVTSRQRAYVNPDCYKGFTASLLEQAVLISL